MRIYTSLHGEQVGLGAPNPYLGTKGPLIAAGGFIAGNHGNQITLPSPQEISFFDDFTGDIIPDQLNITEGTDAATSDFAILAGGMGGIGQFTTGDAGTGLAADYIQLNMALQWQASNGDLCFQTRIKMSAITTCYCFVGFTDTASYEPPIISAGAADTITTTATDAFGFMFDTRMTTKNWWAVGVATDVDAAKFNTAIAPVAAQFQTLRCEINPAGMASFFINGQGLGSMAAACTATTDLTPVIGVGKISVAATMTMDVDYWHVSMKRGPDGGAF